MINKDQIVNHIQGVLGSLVVGACLGELGTWTEEEWEGQGRDSPLSVACKLWGCPVQMRALVPSGTAQQATKASVLSGCSGRAPAA